MYDNGYVRLTALRRDAMLFPQRFASALPPFEGITSPPFASLFPPFEGGEGGCSSAFGYRVPGIT